MLQAATVVTAALLLALTACGTQEVEEEAELPTGPPHPETVSSVTIGSTGDILLHSPIIDAVYNYETGNYDFSEIFRRVRPYYEAPDIMVANLEVTLGGEESGAFSGYPAFNSPDSIAAELKDSGVDVLLTANNHSYDTGSYGFLRTQEVADANGFVHIGSRESAEDRYLYVTMINGIKVGMTCYTYDTREYTDWQKSLNGIVMDDSAADLVNSFSYAALDEFYENVKEDIRRMNMLGIEVKIFYMHWGNEYEDEPNAYQEEIAQKMCDLGVDVIVGGHPHVIQKFDILQNAQGHETYCLYSMGNELSNQRAELMDEDGNRGYTEDGMIFEVKFEKLNNGKVKLRTAKATPTWVDRYYNDAGGLSYEIVPLEESALRSDAERASYERTTGRLGEILQNLSDTVREE